MPLLLLFAVTLFVSATLLFLVQPMVGKMLLPLLGGTPAVWNTCMVFFQALLLAGYAYTHAATGWLGVRRQTLLHLGVLLLPLLTLGLTINRGLLDYGADNPIPGLLLVLLLSVGLPFFAVSTSAPLLQKWFAGTGHPAARDPYFLYGASNLGSMLALGGYPVVIEWQLQWGLPNQRLLWQIGYGVLVLLVAACAACLWRSRAADDETEQVIDRETEQKGENASVSVTAWRRVRWIALAFVPSSLMLGATTYMTTDIAALPLLWVLPLGLYLLSFIVVFSRVPDVVHRVMVVLLPILALGLVFLMLCEMGLIIWIRILVHLAVLFVAAMVCHGELARDRPPTRHLTEFYLWMSVGGVLGGLFNALIAPLIFSGLAEYPLVLVLTCLLTPNLEKEETRIGPALGMGLAGCFLGVGGALLAVALGRNDLEARGLAGAEGLWLAAAVLAAVGGALAYVWSDDSERAARWLDLALPAALGVLTVGLILGWRGTDAHFGLLRSYFRGLAAVQDYLPKRLVAVLDFNPGTLLQLLTFLVPVLLCYLFVKRPVRFGLGVGTLLVAGALCDLLDGNIVLRARSFFGALRVADDGNYRRLDHGTTLHGMQRVRWSRSEVARGAAATLAATDPLRAAVFLNAAQDTWDNPGREPLTYFHRTGPVGQVFEAYRDRLAGRHVGIIGLGSGTLASYGQPGQKVTYYEIDPLIRRIAYDRTYFTYVQDALDRGVVLDLVMGDARIKLEERADQGPPDKFALLVIDAFSSDAIPIHLITKEALEIYRKNLAEDGILAFHISNRYLDLESVLGNLAELLGFVGFIRADSDHGIPGKAASNWVVLAQNESTLDRLVHEGRWEEWQEERGWSETQEAVALLLAGVPDVGGRVQAQAAVCLTLLERLRAPWRRLKLLPKVGIWRDDYSNVLGVFDWKN